MKYSNILFIIHYYFILLTLFVKSKVYIFWASKPNCKNNDRFSHRFPDTSPVCHWLVQQIVPPQTYIIGWEQTNRAMFWKIEPYSHYIQCLHFLRESAYTWLNYSCRCLFSAVFSSFKCVCVCVCGFMTQPSCSSSCMCSEMWKQLWWCVSESFSLSCSEESEN